MPRHVLAALVYSGLTLALTWPLAMHVADLVPHDLGDPLLSTWTLWWNAQVVPFTEQWWNGMAFFPARDTLTFSDHRVGIGLLTTPIIWLGASALAAHNIAFLLSFVLSAVAAYALGFVLTRSHAAAFVGGLVFGFHPFRAEHLPHLELLSSYWLPVVLLALHQWAWTQRRRWLVLLVVSLFFQALTCGYYYVFSGVLVALWLVWFTPRGLPMRKYAELVLALVTPLLAISPILLKYREAHSAMGLARSITEVEQFSADVIGLLTAPELLAVWNAPDAWRRPEGALLPGLTAVALVAVAALRRPAGVAHDRSPWSWTRRALLLGAVAAAAVAAVPWAVGSVAYDIAGLSISVRNPYKPFSIAVLLFSCWFLTSVRVRQAWRSASPLAFYALATIVMWLFALGPTARLLDHRILYKAPYAWLMTLPGFRDEFRAPARFAMLAALTLAVAAALAFWRLAGARTPRLRMATLCVVAAGITADSWVDPFPVMPPPRPLEIPAGVSSDAVILELPLGGVFEDAAAMYRSMFHGRRIVNGLSGYEPPHAAILRGALNEGRVEVIPELADAADIAIFITRGSPDAHLAQAIASRTAARPIASTPTHEVLLLPRAPRIHMGEVGVGPSLPVEGIRSDSSPGDVEKMNDGSRLTAWVTEAQHGDEQFTVDLGKVRDVGGIVLALGGYTASFPRAIAVDLSPTAGEWTEVWDGETSARSLAAALDDPLLVAMPLRFDAQRARYVRIRQTGQSEDPWAVAELRILGAR